MNVPVKPGRMPLKQIKTLSPVAWGLIVFLVVLLGAVAYIVNMVLIDDSPRKKSSVTTVMLLRPPPPVQMKEKPPELEPVKDMKKEEIIDPGPKNDQSDNQDNTPAGDKLGLDADGNPLIPVLTWADTRSLEAVSRLKEQLDPVSTHQRTGCMFHTSYLPAKFLWLRQSMPGVFDRAAWWGSLGEYIFHKFFHQRLCISL
jgi:hypothetical protein